MKKFFKIICFSIFFSLLVGCYYRTSKFPSLVNQGMLPINKEQGYVGANLFLSDEMEKSSYLYNFIRIKGAPDAIEIIETNFDNTRINLYYFDEKEMFYGDINTQDDKYEWIIKGPKIPSWRELRKLRNIMDTSDKDAPFLLFGREFYFPRKKEVKPIKELNLPTSAPTRKIIPRKTYPRKVYQPKRKPTRKVWKASTKKATPTPTLVATKKIEETPATALEETKETPTPTPSIDNSIFASLEDLHNPFTPVNSDIMAIAVSKGYARRNNNGDVIHIVQRYDENLTKIAVWYTGKQSNAIELQRINNLLNTEDIKKGSKIVIPFDMLTNVKQMK